MAISSLKRRRFASLRHFSTRTMRKSNDGGIALFVGPAVIPSTLEITEFFIVPLLQHCFAISYRRENQRQYELKAATETDCKTWIDAIREAR